MAQGAYASTGLLFFGTISSLFNKISKSWAFQILCFQQSQYILVWLEANQILLLIIAAILFGTDLEL